MIAATGVTWSRGRFLAKDRTSPEASAVAFGIGHITRHLFICLGPDCADPEQGQATWEYVKQRLKELNIAGPNGPVYRTKCQCLRICTGGPIAVVYPEGAWYRNVTPDNAASVHCGQGRYHVE